MAGVEENKQKGDRKDVLTALALAYLCSGKYAEALSWFSKLDVELGTSSETQSDIASQADIALYILFAAVVETSGRGRVAGGQTITNKHTSTRTGTTHAAAKSSATSAGPGAVVDIPQLLHKWKPTIECFFPELGVDFLPKLLQLSPSSSAASSAASSNINMALSLFKN